jgi:Membrane dipeptidase (Peptidase family M19)
VNAYLRWSIKDAPNAANPAFFPPLATISQYVDVMDYIRCLVGIDHIGIGSDFTLGDPPRPRRHLTSCPIIRVSSRDALLFAITRVRPEFQSGNEPPSPPRGTAASRLLFRRYRENLWRQLDAGVPRSLERMRLNGMQSKPSPSEKNWAGLE